MFVPGNELLGGSESRAQSTVERVMTLSDDDVEASLASLHERFTSRHEDLRASFRRNFDRVADYVTSPISKSREELLGAMFTHEVSLEGAAICNPSLVASPRQSGLAEGEVRVVMSYRAIGEGHRSSIAFREGVIARDGTFALDALDPFPVVATVGATLMNRNLFHALLRDQRADGDSAEVVLSSLGDEFSEAQLEDAVARLVAQGDTRPNVYRTAQELRSTAAGFYAATFGADISLSRRVLWPAAPDELHGMEDARFVRLVDEGRARYVATYTAFNGVSVAQQLLETDDFVSFVSTPLAGGAARNKGLAVFPRKIDGRFVALSRYDRESNSIAFTDDLHSWDDAEPLEISQLDWEMLQLGNCGAPLELAEGWLVLTHGVGPMRTYAIGALLLDLKNPAKVIARLKLPLLTPSAEEQNGYVPNVVYSCGAFLHHDNVCVPYGVGDQSIRYATVDLAGLMNAMDAV